MDLDKLINRFNSSAPKGWVRSLEACIREDSSVGQFQVVDAASTSRLQNSELHPVTCEDYFLDMDVSGNYSVILQPTLLFTLANARILGPSGDIISSQGKLLAEFTPQNGDAATHSAFQRKRFGKQKYVEGRSLNLATPYSTNYYHWLSEALPGLRALGTELDQVDRVIIPPASAFHLQTLAALGIYRNRILELDNQSHLQCETLLTLSIQRSFAARPQSVQWLQDTLAVQDGIQNKKGKRLYLSRDDAGWRNNNNEEQVIEILSRYGFEAIQPSAYEFSQQVALFGEASTVISAHGAGLTNLVFCKPGTRVLEILPPRWTPVIYAHLCKTAGHIYHYCNAEPLGLSGEQLAKNKSHIPPDQRSQSGSISLPLDKLERFCKTL